MNVPSNSIKHSLFRLRLGRLGNDVSPLARQTRTVVTGRHGALTCVTVSVMDVPELVQAAQNDYTRSAQGS
jgi:hypothetical protein